MRSCCYCKYKDVKTCSFFTFPSDIKRKGAWYTFCGYGPADKVPKTATLCSRHFKDEDFVLGKNGKLELGQAHLILKRNAVPSIREPKKRVIANSNVLTQHSIHIISETEGATEIQEQQYFTHFVKVEVVADDTSTLQVLPEVLPPEKSTTLSHELSETPKKRRVAQPRFVGDICVSDVSSPKKAHRVLQLVRATHERKTNKIAMLTRQNKDLQKRVDSLKELIKLCRKKDCF